MAEYKVNIGAYQKDVAGTDYYVNIGADQTDETAAVVIKDIIQDDGLLFPR